MTAALNYQNIKNNPERISKIKPLLIIQLERNRFSATINNKTIALNILYLPYNGKEIRPAYVSKHNLKHKNQVILLMITDGEKWHYLVVEKLSSLFKGITSNHDRDFYCLNCLYSFRTKNKLKSHGNVCENHDYCHIEMLEENNKILKYNYGEKSIKAPFLIDVDIESLLEKINTCYNNSKKSSTTK